ncbi:MAG: M1 family metallopeptidase [Bacteroidetes bacterium]|nr:M1 family metallopeptidase [Bacteroidota bacterium]
MRNFIFLIASLIFVSCNTTRNTPATSAVEKGDAKIPEPEIFRAAYTLSNDLVHTRLDVKFDWKKKQLNGKATITLHPHFYPTDSLSLNARGMDLHEVSLVKNDGKKAKLEYNYDDRSLIKIKLDRTYKKDENYTVFVDYTSKPEQQKEGGSRAIRKDKGLYFINADGSNPEKPRQVWTQGETESNSVWFPTIEDPQQKMTQEIYITVDTSLTTVSNGLLLTSVNNNDGTKTDYWKQSLPAAPYLTMIAASNFAIVKDKWRNIEVNYYLDKEYAKYAKMIFGLTPEMISCFSNLLGIEYPWEKYAQVVVYDYVSGAMENTTAVVHGTNMLQDSSDYVDGNYEDYISHELFHHWFGDLVTCESWSNITLNESFANYAEYLWREYKYGRDDADHVNQNDQAVYFLVTKSDDPSLVRFDYDNREDVYDAISYNKGGRILHMLRKYVGDDAFFASLKLYLETHLFGSAEAHDLRLAFEKVTGEDLNWFFNEWYFKGGHPVIEINYDWNDSTKTETVTVEQKQDFEKNPLYRIPLQTDVYHDGIVEHKKIVLEHAKEIFEWKYGSKPDLINMDAERMLLAEKKDNKSRENYVFQYYHAPLYLDRFEALNKTGTDYEENTAAGKMMEDALADKYWNIRVQALKNIGTQLKANKERMKPVIIKLAVGDSAAAVRTQAIKMLGKYFKEDAEAKKTIENAVNDISYNVQAAAFKLVAENDKQEATKVAKQLETRNGSDVLNAVASYYSEEAQEENNDFFLDAMTRLRRYGRGTFAGNYAKYLKKVKQKTWEKGVDKLEESARNSSGYSRKMIIAGLEDLAKDLGSKADDAKTKADDLKKNNGGQNEISLAERESEALLARQKALKDRIRKLDEKAVPVEE